MPKNKRPGKSGKPGTPRPKRGGRSRGTHSKGGRSSQPQEQEDGLIELKLKAMANGGYALGTANRRTVFVPYTIPGERIKARVVDSQRSVDFAEGVKLLDASADRVYPQCPHFGPAKCWGCQWQHIGYKAQLLLKQDVLADQLYRLGKFEDPILERAVKPVKPSPKQWGYNFNMTFERDSEGNLGFMRRDGRSVEPITECHILHPDLLTLYQMIDLSFEEMTRLSLFRGSDGETMMVLYMTSEEAPELTTDLPTSINVILPDNEPVNLIGNTVIYYEIGGRLFRMTAGGNFRANLEQTENLIGEVLQMLELTENDSVLDLYAGVGVFSAFFAARAGLVTLVESYPPMVTDADQNLSEFDNVDIIEGTVEDVLATLVDAGEIYDAALLDPPSSGLSRDVIDALQTMNMPRLVYISSEPATLARDASQLVKAGYRMERVQPFDFAPQTYYIETAVLFVK